MTTGNRACRYPFLLICYTIAVLHFACLSTRGKAGGGVLLSAGTLCLVQMFV